jgi:hypothetical protein
VYIENEGTGYLFKKWCHRQGKNPFEKEKSWHRKQTKFTEGTYMRSLNSYFLLIFFFRRGAWKWIAISIILCSNPLLVVCFGFCFFYSILMVGRRRYFSKGWKITWKIMDVDWFSRWECYVCDSSWKMVNGVNWERVEELAKWSTLLKSPNFCKQKF